MIELDIDLVLVRVAHVLVAAVLIGTGYQIWQNVATNLHEPAMFASLACYIAGFAAIVRGFFARNRPAVQWSLVGLLVFAFLAYALPYVAYDVTYYGTDSMLFNVYSAQLLLHGIDPYTQSMERAFALFHVPENLVTPTSQGGAVYLQSYPALSFLIFVPFMLLKVGNMLWVPVAAHVAALLALATVAPPRLRAFFPLVLFVDPSYFSYTVGAVTDIMWVPLMVVAAAVWRSRPLTAAILLGAACAFKQTPWLVVPFAGVDWVRRRDALAAGAFVLTFGLPNLPFALWHPEAWVQGVTEPVTGRLIPFGSGLAQLATSNYLAFDPRTYAILMAVVFLTALALYAIDAERFAFLPFLSPALALFVASRSLQNYFMFWPAVLLGVVALRPIPASAVVRVRPLRAVVATGGGMVVLALAFALYRTVTYGLSLDVADKRIAPDIKRIVALRVIVHNTAPADRRLRLGVMSTGHGNAVRYWNHGLPVNVPRGETVKVWIEPDLQSDGIPGDGKSATQIIAMDLDGGRATYSSPRVFRIAGSIFPNADLTKWAGRAKSRPASWDYDENDFRTRRIARARIDGRDALLYHVPHPTDGVWRVASVSQDVTSTLGTFSAWLRPEEDYDGGAYPRASFGVEVIDALGRHVQFAIDSRLSVPRIYRRDQFTFVILPGTLHRWNDVKIDLRPFARDGSFLSSSGAIMNVNIIGAVHTSHRGDVNGAFGGISIDQTPLAAPLP